MGKCEQKGRGERRRVLREKATPEGEELWEYESPEEMHERTSSLGLLLLSSEATFRDQRK